MGGAGQLLDRPVVLRWIVLGFRGAGAVGRLGLRAGGGAAARARAARLAGRRQGVVLLPPLPGLELGLPAGEAGGAPGALQLEGGGGGRVDQLPQGGRGGPGGQRVTVVPLLRGLPNVLGKLQVLLIKLSSIYSHLVASPPPAPAPELLLRLPGLAPSDLYRYSRYSRYSRYYR